MTASSFQVSPPILSVASCADCGCDDCCAGDRRGHVALDRGADGWKPPENLTLASAEIADKLDRLLFERHADVRMMARAFTDRLPIKNISTNICSG